MMPTKSLNSRVSEYRKMLANGGIQATYQSLVSILQTLRTEFSKKYKGTYTVASVSHGYLDFTYFYLQNDYLKKNKLKYAIVLNHQKAGFELWLLGQTKDVQERYWNKLKHLKWVDEHSMPEYSVFEIPLLENPNFDDAGKLTDRIHAAFASLSQEIFDELKAVE